MFAGHGALDILSLAALAVRGQNEAPGDLVGALWPKVPAYEVQAQVQAGGTAGGGQDAAFVDVKHVRDEAQAWAASDELLGVLPVRGGVAAVEKSSSRQHESAGAQRHDTGAGGMGLAQRGA